MASLVEPVTLLRFEMVGTCVYTKYHVRGEKTGQANSQQELVLAPSTPKPAEKKRPDPNTLLVRKNETKN